MSIYEKMFGQFAEVQPQTQGGLVNVGTSQSTQRNFSYQTTDARQFSKVSSTTDARVFAPTMTIIQDSAGANVSKKDEISSSPSSDVSPEIVSAVSPSLTPSQTTTGSDLKTSGIGTVLLYGGVGLVGYVLLKRLKVVK